MRSKSKHVFFNADKRISFEDTELNPELVRVLQQRFSIQSLYEMQALTLSYLQKRGKIDMTEDLIVCAPTGSGKTLAYALPIAQALQDTCIPRLRGIVVVPTRDLARQVAHVFRILFENDQHAVAVATGATSVAREARALLHHACQILVATPGRLVHHTRHTTGVRLDHVRYFVLDESDRLLHDSYNQWLASVMPLIGKAPTTNSTFDSHHSMYRPSTGAFAHAIVPAVALASGSVFKASTSDPYVCKILVSATQTHNPTHMVHLNMRHPTIFRAHGSSSDAENNGGGENRGEERYVVPSTLQESVYVVKGIQEKPAALLRLLGWTGESNHRRWRRNSAIEPMDNDGAKLVFTNSIESAHRLCRLLELCAYALGRRNTVLEMSGELSTERRREVVSLLKSSNEISRANADPATSTIIVCSDVLSRGMDMITVDRVINYDAPVHVRTYLHRAGRTARAGRSGRVHSLLLAKQMYHFRRMVHEVDRGNRSVRTINLRIDDFLTQDLQAKLSKSLISLKRVINREKYNLLPRESSLPRYALYELEKRHEEDSIHLEEERQEAREEYTEKDGERDEYTADEGQENNADWFENDGDERGYGRKRKTRDNETEEDEDVDKQENGEEEGRWDKDEVEEGIDSVSNLIYAQIAKNCIMKHE